MSSLSVSLLTIGTEITTGQILNRNTQWLAQKMTDAGLDVTLHLSVPDERKLMREAIELARDQTNLVLITGGLGPTSDDFTREVVAQVAGAPLEWDPPCWAAIEELLGKRGIPIAESNRQQCYLPRGSQALLNPAGTAAGFRLELPKKEGKTLCYVLPGPPREIEAIWNAHSLDLELEKFRSAGAPPPPKEKLFSWLILAKSESEVGEIVEAAIAPTGLRRGYRAHRPFVEVKVWCPLDQVSTHVAAFSKLEYDLLPWLYLRPDETPWRERFFSQMFSYLAHPNNSVVFMDGGTGGRLTRAVGDILREEANLPFRPRVQVLTSWDAPSRSFEAEGQMPTRLLFGVSPFSESGESWVGVRMPPGAWVRTKIQTPYSESKSLMDRTELFATELAWRHFAEIFEKLQKKEG